MEWNVEHIAEREEASGAREWSREIRSWKFLSRAAMWLQDQARPARQGKARPDAANHPPHLVSSTRRCAFGERPETLERCSFVAVPEGPRHRHRRIPGLRHRLENLLPSSGLHLNCDDPGIVRVPAVSPLSLSAVSTIIIILPTLLVVSCFFCLHFRILFSHPQPCAGTCPRS
jgi:hypothetical protein